MATESRKETVVVPAPVVNVPVQINNVRDPNEIPDALDKPEAQQKILNTVRENPDAIRVELNLIKEDWIALSKKADALDQMHTDAKFELGDPYVIGVSDNA